MTASKKAQEARSAAERRLREAHHEEFVALMSEEYAKRDLTWKRRLTAEERQERERARKQAKSLEKISELADAAGLTVDDLTSALKVSESTAPKFGEPSDGRADG